MVKLPNKESTRITDVLFEISKLSQFANCCGVYLWISRVFIYYQFECFSRHAPLPLHPLLRRQPLTCLKTLINKFMENDSILFVYFTLPLFLFHCLVNLFWKILGYFFFNLKYFKDFFVSFTPHSLFLSLFFFKNFILKEFYFLFDYITFPASPFSPF